MLEKSDTNLGQALAAFNSYGAEVALIVPTQTGLQKSIMDATQIVRDFLRNARSGAGSKGDRSGLFGST
jgi:hypothetical protein